MMHPTRWSRSLRCFLLVPLAAIGVTRALAADTPPPVERKLPVPFVEEFNDNEGGWILKGDGLEGVIRDGRLEIENLSAEGSVWTYKELQQAPAGDFEISLTMTPPEGTASAEAGLVWDMNSGDHRRVQLGRDFLRHDYLQGGKWDLEFSRMTKWPGIRSGPGAKNELVFRVLGRRAFILVNGTAVHALDYTQPRQRYAGVIVSAGTQVAFERLAIQPLKLTDAARATELARLEREARTSTIASGPKTEPFVETFEDNRRQWPYLGDRTDGSGAIKNGEFAVHNRREKNTSMDLIPVPINDATDYEITMRAKNVGTTDNHQIALAWGRTDDGTSMGGFAFSGNRQWTAYAVKDGKFVSLHPWRASTAVKASGEMNELVVRKLADTVFLLINGQVVGDFPAARLLGSGFGLEIGPGVQAAIDELRVTYPGLSAEAAEKQKRDLLAALEVAHGKAGLGATSAIAAQKAEAAKKQASKPTKKDWEEQDKMNRRYQGKKLLAVLADKPRPARRIGGEFTPILYYHYRNIGGVDYYFEFICAHETGTGKQSLQNVYVLQVFLTDIIRG